MKRARIAKVHALVCACLKKMMPSMFGKEKKQKELLKNLDVIFQAVAQARPAPSELRRRRRRRQQQQQQRRRQQQ